MKQAIVQFRDGGELMVDRGSIATMAVNGDAIEVSCDGEVTAVVPLDELRCAYVVEIETEDETRP